MDQRIAPVSDNLLQTLQQLVQDVIAPDVRELKVRVASLEKQVDVRFNALEQRMDAQFKAIEGQFKGIESRFKGMDEKNDAQFRAIMAAFSESKAQGELSTMKLIAALSERVAVLEAQRH
jgi:hypothetical protein